MYKLSIAVFLGCFVGKISHDTVKLILQRFLLACFLDDILHPYIYIFRLFRFRNDKYLAVMYRTAFILYNDRKIYTYGKFK